MIRLSPVLPGLFEFGSAGTVQLEVVSELGGVLGGISLQLRRVALNCGSMHAEDHRHLRERLARAAFQECLGLLMRLL
uniref:hypothetical protein n=1 Tax=Mycobacterium avium TaxID=1764 RepID=UPI001F1FCAFF